jgi:hypothetical protein
MPNAIVVLSDLGVSVYREGEGQINKAFANLKSETRRIALPITPVNPQGDELFQILRRRFFGSLPDECPRKAVAERYRSSHAEAVKMGLSSSSSDGVYHELARGFGVREVKPQLAVAGANQTRIRTASEFANRDPGLARPPGPGRGHGGLEGGRRVGEAPRGAPARRPLPLER